MPTTYDDIIEISSDSGEELTMRPSQVPQKKCRPAKNAYTGAQAKNNVVPFVDKDIHGIQMTIPPMKELGSRGQKTTDALTIFPDRSMTSVQKFPRKQKMSLRQVELDHYARELFKQLNSSVFDERLPDTELMWNARFCTTAGRAYYHRDRKSSIVTKIELSSKVVDCEDRVRCVLAHEMCHLAVWTLDDDPTERGHGTKFKRWASRVEKTRPDIVVNTTHSYEIRYKYRWECMQCGKIYGRHSNSINIEKNACGACTPPGTLKALSESQPDRKVAYKERNLATIRGAERQSSNHLEPEAENTLNDQEMQSLLPKILSLSI